MVGGAGDTRSTVGRLVNIRLTAHTMLTKSAANGVFDAKSVHPSVNLPQMREPYGDPPGEPDAPQESEEIRMMLEEAGVPEDVIVRVDKIVMRLIWEASRDC